MINPIEELKRRGHKAGLADAKALGFLLATLIATGSIIQMARDAYLDGGVLFHTIQAIALFGGVELIAVILFGFYLGLLSLLWIDIRNRWQATLLTAATVFGLSTLYRQSLIPEVDAVFQTLGAICFGASIGLYWGGGTTVFNPDSQLEFPKVSMIVNFLIMFITMLVFIESNLIYSSPLLVNEHSVELLSPKFNGFELDGIIVDAFAVAVSIIIYNNNYVLVENEREIAVFGPAAAGKTTLVLGLYHVASQEQDEWPTYPSDNLIEMYNNLTENGEWPPRTAEPFHSDFRYWTGKILTRNIHLNTIDYPGEQLHWVFKSEDIDNLREAAERRRFMKSREEPFDSGILERPQAPNEVFHTIGWLLEKAGLIIFVLDIESFSRQADNRHNEPDYYLDTYESIVKQYPETEIRLVATKTDLLLEEFDGNPEHDYNEFKDWVNSEYFTQDRISSYSLLEELQNRSQFNIHPVYYKTEGERDFNSLPELQEPIEVVGFKELLESL